MPTKSNNTGGRGGKRPGAGRKPKATLEKAQNGNPGGRKLTMLDIPDVEGIHSIGCAGYVSPQTIERYAMCVARWLQCEEMTNELGFLSKHPTTGKPVTSPFINIGINYMNQASRQWDNIMQIVKENCSVDFSGANPNDDLERLLHQRKGF